MTTMIYEMQVTYFVIEKATEEVLATTKKLEVAEFLRDNYPTESVIRSDVRPIAKLKTL